MSGTGQRQAAMLALSAEYVRHSLVRGGQRSRMPLVWKPLLRLWSVVSLGGLCDGKGKETRGGSWRWNKSKPAKQASVSSALISEAALYGAASVV